jgi:hypothetical protein
MPVSFVEIKIYSRGIIIIRQHMLLLSVDPAVGCVYRKVLFVEIKA